MSVTKEVVQGVVEIKDNIAIINTYVLGLKVKKRLDVAIILNIMKAFRKIKKTLNKVEKLKKTKNDEKMIQLIKTEISSSIIPLEPIKTYEGGEFILNYYKTLKE